MRNAALVLGIIGGLWAMVVGFFGYGYTVFVDAHPDMVDWLDQVRHPEVIRAASFAAPILAIAGGAMARSRNVVAGVLLLLAAAAIFVAFRFNVFTMFPIAMCGLGGILALAARQPDAH